MKHVAILFEVVVKLVIGFSTGLGLGLLTFGAALIRRGAVVDFAAMENGPPPAETFLAGGVAFLATGLALLLLFVGPFSKRRWFVLDDDQSTTD